MVCSDAARLRTLTLDEPNSGMTHTHAQGQQPLIVERGGVKTGGGLRMSAVKEESVA